MTLPTWILALVFGPVIVLIILAGLLGIWILMNKWAEKYITLPWL